MGRPSVAMGQVILKVSDVALTRTACDDCAFLWLVSAPLGAG